jgi:hypothetical protein
VPANALRLFLDEDARRNFEKKFGAVPERDRRHILYLLGLADAIKKRDSRELKNVVVHYTQPIEDFQDGPWITDYVWDEVRRSPLRQLGEALNSGIREVQLVVWWAKHEKKFAPGLYCKDISAALHALTLSRIGESNSLAVCGKCHSPFIRTRLAQVYCSSRCRVAAGMDRYRRRKKRSRRTKE